MRSGMPTFSLVTTCKGRLDHLRQTLPSMTSQDFHEVVVVDYDCPQGTSKWIRANHPSVVLAEVQNEPWFNVSRARNVGAARSSGDVLCFVDADVVLADGYLRWFANHFVQNNFYILGVGTPVCTRAQFEAVGGYDDVIAGWGGEDWDFCLRLREAGYDLELFPEELIKARIQHSDLMRTAYYDVKDKQSSMLRARYYIAAKQKLKSVSGVGAFPRSVRESLYLQTEQISSDYRGFKEATARSLRFEVELRPKNERASQDKIVLSISRKEAKYWERVRDEMKQPKRLGLVRSRYEQLKRALPKWYRQIGSRTAHRSTEG
jgi:glycosyltransferase involved in cell wall biosynthesis